TRERRRDRRVRALIGWRHRRAAGEEHCEEQALHAGASARADLSRARYLLTTTKNIGMRKMARNVADSMPPSTPMPMACWLAEPAPREMVSGSTPRPKASEVMMIGRSLRLAASSAASNTDLPAS